MSEAPPPGPSYQPGREPTHEQPPGSLPEPPYDGPGETDWQRLDARMLLVHPVRELVRFLPFVVGVFLAGNATAGPAEGPMDLLFHLGGVVLPIGLGLLRYLTTQFRFRAGRLELRRGLVSRHQLSVPLDRVRTVDLEASPVQRVLGLVTARVGTGTSSGDDDERVDLDGLPAERADDLRRWLLGHRAGVDGSTATGDAPTPGQPAPAARVVVRFHPSWLRFAPLTSAGLAAAAGTVAVVSQVVNVAGGWDRLLGGGLPQASTWVVVALVALVVVAVLGVLPVAGYLLRDHGFTLSRDAEAFHVSRGLLTTRQTTLDVDRVAGVVVHEPLGLRSARGARLTAIVTGLGRRQSESGVLVPPAPRSVVEAVAADVVGVPVGATALRPHGPAATRRRLVRAVAPALVLLVAAVVAATWGGWSWWVAAGLVVVAGLAVLLGRDRARALGHALVLEDRHGEAGAGLLVVRSGSLARHHDVLGLDHVIGWNLRSTWFQRRVGLTTLVATTAGGRQAVVVPDVRREVAVALAHEALPAVVAPFLDAPPARRPRGSRPTGSA